MTKPTREQIEAFRKENFIHAHVGEIPNAGLEAWAVESNMVLDYLCGLALSPEATRRTDAIGPATASHDSMVWDAARYRFLRNNAKDAAIYAPSMRLELAQGKMLDDAIDAAIASQRTPQRDEQA